MTRTAIIAATAFLAACSSGEGDAPALEQSVEPGLFADAQGERGGLCIDTDGDAAFVLYGEGDANCMAEGLIQPDDSGGLAFVPRGDNTCSIPLTQDGETLTFGEADAACSYYCGGDSTLAGRTVRRTDSLEPLTDMAGDRLC